MTRSLRIWNIIKWANNYYGFEPIPIIENIYLCNNKLALSKDYKKYCYGREALNDIGHLIEFSGDGLYNSQLLFSAGVNDLIAHIWRYGKDDT
jgi:hypothetical protein